MIVQINFEILSTSLFSALSMRMAEDCITNAFLHEGVQSCLSKGVLVYCTSRSVSFD